MRIFLYECICAGGLGLDVPDSLQREGWAMLCGVVEDFQRLPAVEVVTLLDERLPCTFPWPHRLGVATTRIPWQEEKDRFRALAATCAATLVIAPEFNDLLRSRSHIVVESGGLLLGSLPRAIAKTGDKWQMALHWQRHGVPHPRTELLDPHRLASFPLPCVLKPRHGAGSQATFLLRTELDREHRYRTAPQEWPHGELIVQQYIPGQPASIALLRSAVQVLPLLPAWQHLSTEGRLRYEGGSMPLPEPLARRALRLAQSALEGLDGLQGYIGIDLVLGSQTDGGGDHVIEINPRLTTSYLGLRQLCRQNLAELMLSGARGETMEPPAWLPGEVRFGGEPETMHPVNPDCSR